MIPEVVIIGIGKIGSAVYERVKAKQWKVPFVLDSNGMYKDPTKKEKLGNLEDYKTRLDSVDLGFLDIYNSDDGKIAYEYICHFLKKKIPVVTSEKGALSNYFSELEWAVRQGRIGYSATAGGGSELLRYLEERINPEIEEIHAVVNGTLNYIFTGLSEGKSLGEVVEETKRLGYAEPGARESIDVINKEATVDVPMKSSIIFNICNLTKKRMRAREVVVQTIELNQLKRLVKEAANRRYIVSITREEDNEEDVIWGFRHSVGEWNISAGFKHIEDNPLFKNKKLIPKGVDNAVLISNGKYGKDVSYPLHIGPGAGPGPTSASMMRDAERILLR